MIDWRHWHNEPFLTGGLIFLGWLYAIMAGPLRERLAPGEPYPRGKAAAFYSSLLIFYIAVGSPLDQVGERFLLSAHMVQHQLIMYPAPLLFLIGLPAWMVDPLLDRRGARRFWRLLFHPFACGFLSVLVISVWHAPGLYEWTLQDKLAHVAEHLMFFAVSLLYWWPLASPSRAFPVPGHGARMLYIIGTEIGTIPVSAYIIFSTDVLYPTYLYAPRLIGNLSPAADQLIAGILMKFVGMAVSLAAIGVVFYGWQKAPGPGPKPWPPE
jgi:putative membrane protein